MTLQLVKNPDILAEVAALSPRPFVVGFAAETDGDGPGRYLLQIFMVEGGLLYDDSDAGPFFYEVIQRFGARGFGEGNFRALFESIERDQLQRAAAEGQLGAGAGS